MQNTNDLLTLKIEIGKSIRYDKSGRGGFGRNTLILKVGDQPCREEDGISASGITNAISAMTTNSDEIADNHPEKRVRAAFKVYHVAEFIFEITVS